MTLRKPSTELSKRSLWVAGVTRGSPSSDSFLWNLGGIAAVLPSDVGGLGLR